jgi:hypothetical protein
MMWVVLENGRKSQPQSTEVVQCSGSLIRALR